MKKLSRPALRTLFFLGLLVVAVAAFSLAASANSDFRDVAADAWYAEAVDYCHQNDLMRGTADKTFSPQGVTSRSMMATVLHRAAGEPQAKGDTFRDVPADRWDSAAVAWASANKVMQGYGNGVFGAADAITREQVITTIWRYRGSPAALASSPFADENDVSAYAKAAVRWAKGCGLSKGRGDDRFVPKANINRAELATVLMNYDRLPAEPSPGGKTLVVYFSATGHTAKLAQIAQAYTGGDLFEIVPEQPYTEADLAYYTDCRADREQKDPAARPAIANEVTDMAAYDTVILGYPIWHGQAPRIISTFLESYDFDGKTIIPFCTSHSSDIGNSDTDLHPLAAKAHWQKGKRFAADTGEADFNAWLTTMLPPPPAPTAGLSVVVNGKTFTASAEKGEAASAFLKSLPLTVAMTELNGNEKYAVLDAALPADDRDVKTIKSGDIMLYNGNTLVLFYEDFTTTYRYTPLAHIDDVSGLKAALGDGNVTVTFSGGEQVGKFDLKTKTVLLNSGYTMPILGLGTYSLTGETCVASVKAELQAGGRLIDTAYMYHNEAEVGQGVRESGVPREEVFVTTKLYPNQFKDAAAAIDEALKKLDIGYIDLMLLHHPGDGDVAAYKAMEDAVAAGKIRSIGLSNWYVKELEAFLPQVSIPPAVVQNEIHPYYQENDVIPYVQNKGIVMEGWYPLGGRGHTAELLGDATIGAIAEEHNVSAAQVILRWNLQKGVVVIPGSSNPDHIKENLDLFDFTLSDDEMAKINALDRNEKHDWY